MASSASDTFRRLSAVPFEQRGARSASASPSPSASGDDRIPRNPDGFPDWSQMKETLAEEAHGEPIVDERVFPGDDIEGESMTETEIEFELSKLPDQHKPIQLVGVGVAGPYAVRPTSAVLQRSTSGPLPDSSSRFDYAVAEEEKKQQLLTNPPQSRTWDPASTRTTPPKSGVFITGFKCKCTDCFDSIIVVDDSKGDVQVAASIANGKAISGGAHCDGKAGGGGSGKGSGGKAAPKGYMRSGEMQQRWQHDGKGVEKDGKHVDEIQKTATKI